MDETQARQALREKYQTILEAAWTQSKQCPICDSDAWNIGDVVNVGLRMLERPSLAQQMGGEPPQQAYVYLPVTCLVCGYTILFHTGTLDMADARRRNLYSAT